MSLPTIRRASVSDIEPALPIEYQRGPATDCVDAFPCPVAGWLHGERQAMLQGVPVHDNPIRIGPHGPDEGVRQLPLVRGLAGGGAVASRSGHAE